MRWLALVLAALAAQAAERETWLVDTGPANSPRPGAGHARLWTALAHPERCGVNASAGGKAVKARVLWAAPGEPVQVLIDGAATGEVQVVVGDDIKPDESWWPQAGVVGEVRSRGPGDPDSVKRMEEIFAAGRIQGRALLTQVFQGFNPCGPGGDIALESTAWIKIPSKGNWRFHTISGDASAVWIDGRQVVAWPGWHNLDGGKRGERSGTIELEAGVHRLRHLLVQRGGWICSALAWTPPWADKPEIVPPTAFVPVAAWEARPAAAGPWFMWEPSGSTRCGGRPLVEMAFGGRGVGAEVRWRFDDGLPPDQGQAAKRLFARAGLRSVVLDYGGRQVKRQVAVRERWDQLGDWDSDAVDRRLAELAGRDLKALAGDDLASFALLVAGHDDRARLPALVPALVARAQDPKDLGGAQGDEALFAAGMALQEPPLKAHREAEALWKALLARHGARDALRERTALHLAGLYVHVLGRTAEGKALLDGLALPALSDDERRLVRIYLGDAALAAGDVDAARAAYRSAGTTVDPQDRARSARRRTRLEGAREQLARDDAEAASRLLREIEWEVPEERLGPETGLLWARVHLARKDPAPAILRLRALLHALPGDDRRAEALWLLAKACDQAGDREGAAAARTVLAKDHPYSEWAVKK
jgi:hypothetical protein